MKNKLKILLVCLLLGFAFSRTSDKYKTVSINDFSITNPGHNKMLSQHDCDQSDDSLKWKRRHKRRKKMRRKKRGM